MKKGRMRECPWCENVARAVLVEKSDSFIIRDTFECTACEGHFLKCRNEFCQRGAKSGEHIDSQFCEPCGKVAKDVAMLIFMSTIGPKYKVLEKISHIV
jgi:hypothetical protein